MLTGLRLPPCWDASPPTSVFNGLALWHTVNRPA